MASRDQERLRSVTKKDYVLTQLKTKKKFSVRYQIKDNSFGLKYLEIHFSATEKENCAIFALRDINAVVEQEEKYKLEARQRLEDILEGARTGIWTIELEEGCPPRMLTVPCGSCWGYQMRLSQRRATSIGLSALTQTMWIWCRRQWQTSWRLGGLR